MPVAMLASCCAQNRLLSAPDHQRPAAFRFEQISDGEMRQLHGRKVASKLIRFLGWRPGGDVRHALLQRASRSANVASYHTGRRGRLRSCGRICAGVPGHAKTAAGNIQSGHGCQRTIGLPVEVASRPRVPIPQDVTRTWTDMRSKASLVATKLPVTGITCRMSRPTARGTRSAPPTLRFVGSKVIQPAPGT